MNKLFLLGLLVFLTSCATGPTCDGLKIEKQKRACYNDLKTNQQEMWLDREFTR